MPEEICCLPPISSDNNSDLHLSTSLEECLEVVMHRLFWESVGIKTDGASASTFCFQF